MTWNYAELSKMAKANGGPEKLMDIFINSGKRKMFPWLGVAVAVGATTTIAVQKAYKYLSNKKAKSDTELELVKKELIQGIKNYDAINAKEHSDIIIRKFLGNKKEYMDLLLLADEQEDMIDKYLERGEMFVLENDGVKGECVVTKEADGVYEIKNIAVLPDCQRNGYGKSMIDFVFSYYNDFIAKGNEGINVVDHRFTNNETIKHFNRIIVQHKTDSMISNQKDITYLI